MSKVEQPGIGSMYIACGDKSNNPDCLAHVHKGALSVMDHFEHGVAEGACYIVTDMEAMSDTETKEYAIQISDATSCDYTEIGLQFNCAANNSITVELFRDPNISDAGYVAGSDIAVQNRNDNYSDCYSDISVIADPTLVTSYGVPWMQYYGGGSFVPTSVQTNMFQLALGSNYIIRVTANAATTTMSINMTFIGHTTTAYTPS
ncbi:MAG: hypothetical protein GY841_04465 [FCB group bacterium]|nr:hypothetical protein [FCB group bacterium]